ncbi:MAG: nucleotidyltransferase domain-containing protein [Magnetococcales bacterium]|nr:nucleotidyltransferase domain-containing protein [Magnetococcales bacterium]
MIDEGTLQRVGAILGEAAGPSRVILFGSHARGEASEASDLDLLVIEPVVEHRLREMVRLRQLLRPLRIPVDLLVCSLSEADERRGQATSAVHWALAEGRTLHDSLG